MSSAGTFDRLAKRTARATGHYGTFAVALGIIILWAVTGPLFNFSDTWQLFINTGTTIVTFLMVFLIQNTQNRDSAAMQIKLDELIRANKAAENRLLNLEDLTEEELEQFRARYVALARDAKAGRPKNP